MVLSFPSLPIAADIKTNQKPTPFTIRCSRFQEVEKDLSVEEDNEKKKLRLAEIGTSMLMDPEGNIKNLKEMLQICKGGDREILILSLKTLVVVFKDIIPVNCIRLPTNKEIAMVVSNDVRKTRLYESTILNVYKNNNRVVNEELWTEAKTYGDIQQMTFVDYSSLISWKTIAICIFVTEVIFEKYLMKTDDDTFIRVDEVLASLNRVNVSHGLLYGLINPDSQPHQNPDSKSS
ncbi:beta-1,3-galactosyltransferase GALT1 [Tanacetum coccineum]